MENIIQNFIFPNTSTLTIVSDYGNGNGYGYGYGNSYGNNYGNSYGNNYGNGNGNDYGYGYGNGNDNDDDNGNGYGYGDEKNIITFNKQTVYQIDNISTIISTVKKNIAKGFILNKDFTLTPCYIIKSDNLFAHGKTLQETINSLQEKINQKTPLSERITNFKNTFKDYSLPYFAIDLFIWHGILTGSCLTGRENFCKNHNIDLSKSMFTIYEFIEITKGTYQHNIIQQLVL